MFRFLFRLLIAPHLPAPVRSQARRPQPQLEAMEDRITPSPLAHPADGNLNSFSGAGNAPESRPENQGCPHTVAAADPCDPVVPDTPASNNISVTACTDLVFQRLYGGESGVSTPACKDSVFQGLQNNGYLVWVAGDPDAAPPTNAPPDVFLAFGDFLQAIATETTENAKNSR
jgi:hypothetical protein